MRKFSCLLLLLGVFLIQEVKAQVALDVSTFNQFEKALKNANVTTINVVKGFRFTKNIVDVPNRDIQILGNKDLDVVIESNIYSIYGKQNYKSRNTFSIINANIIGAQDCGRFFTGGAGNGPSSHGWDVYAKDVKYSGARFVHLSEGTLTFDGYNTIDTSCENAWVHSLVFMKSSVYKGTAATIGQFSAFYFNGDLIKGKAVGTVDIQENAKVDLTISPYNNKYYYYPAFYDKVYKVDVKDRASLKVDAAGVAFQFIPRADYLAKPSFNINAQAGVDLIGRGGGDYATVKLQYYKTAINVNPEGELRIVGNSSKGVIESIYKDAEINVNGGRLSIENRKSNSPLFKSIKTVFNLQHLRYIDTWGKTGGTYDYQPTRTFKDFKKLYTIINKSANGVVTSDNSSVTANFQLENYGKIGIVGTIIEPMIMRSIGDITEPESAIIASSQNGILTVTSDKTIESLELYSIQGKLVTKQIVNNNTSSIALPTGVYIIKAIVGGQVQTTKALVK